MGSATPFYITTAISYPNGAPHIGHAYEAIATDAIARFERLDGRPVYFLTGTDEHGIKMVQTARNQNMTPAELADRNTPLFRAMAEALNISNDDFIRTREERHHRASQEMWRRLEANGDIYLGRYAGWYSVRDEAYYDEGELSVTEDGTKLSPQGTPVEWVEEETFFFRLSAYQDRLLAYYEANPEFILPLERRNEVLSFVKGGLRDLSISRTTFNWGVPVPGHPEHVMYVWVDALTNYITGVGFPDEADPKWKFWPANVHVIGKDILRFHAVYWPAFLMSAGVEPPRRVFAHGMVLNKGEKMSKSVGNVADPHDLVSTFGLDQLRYFLLREVAFGQDGSYSEEAIINRTNADLANDLGNLAQRSLSMIAKNCEGRVPTPGALTEEDRAILSVADGMYAKAREAMELQGLKKYLDAVWAVVAEANRYFASQEPWAKKKSDFARMETILYVTVEVVRQVAILAQPAMPESCAKLLDQLGLGEDQRSFSQLGEGGRLASGLSLPPPAGVFPRYVSPEEQAKREGQEKPSGGNGKSKKNKERG
ncbi:Methionine--tRNA ligase [Candidatus Filomicrobium marinum]|uniref:Methionine--tRNA ligase n=1 Tax=Candidatus Filomicrobium marinum TaxID=1608628 RepID=A0A0D6JJ99_9HYPH|nr:methionine--tRNA ligase [Candidatus Filomicrobium marinum]CFX36869.1 Methionine--tRNA ligase [Candidatus Filomicrobium marinum]CPR21689.1 Methionine--tRNA ligase [Candidatus Filomicrobium marinum]